MLVLYTRYYFLKSMMIGCKQMENSILSCFGRMIYIFLKLAIKNLQLHYSSLFHHVPDLNQINIRKINKSFPPLSKTDIHIPTKKIVHHFKQHKFCKPLSIFINHLYIFTCLWSFCTVPVTAICIVSSPLLISANISKSVLVTPSTVSVIYLWCSLVLRAGFRAELAGLSLGYPENPALKPRKSS